MAYCRTRATFPSPIVLPISTEAALAEPYVMTVNTWNTVTAMLLAPMVTIPMCPRIAVCTIMAKPHKVLERNTGSPERR